MLDSLLNFHHLGSVFVHEELVVHDGSLVLTLMQVQIGFYFSHFTIRACDLLKYFPSEVIVHVSTLSQLIIQDVQFVFEAKGLVNSRLKHLLRLREQLFSGLVLLVN